MNCEKVNLLLDTKSPAELTTAERQAVDQHLASCSDCREAWDAYDELAASPIPATPPYLRVRIATALAARAIERRHARRGLLIGAVLIVGAAVAATAVIRVANHAPDPVQKLEEVAPAVEPVVPSAPGSSPASDGAVPRPAETVVPGAAAATGTYPLDPYSVLVVSLNDPNADAEAAAALADCHDGIVEQLRRVVGLNVIAGERLKPFTGSTSSEIEVARQQGAGRVLILRSINRQPSCSAERVMVETGASEGVFLMLPGERSRASWQGVGESVARSIRESVFKDETTLEAEARAKVLNTSLSDGDRAAALYRFRPAPGSAPYDEATLAAAVQIGMNSRDADARSTAWSALRGVTDPSILQPLLYALANDAVEDVRSDAALALVPFGDQPAVKEALTRAAAVAPSLSPKVSCCSLTLRAAARLALRGGEPTEAIRENVLDESLTPQERLVLVPPRGDRARRLDELGDEAARAVFALGSSSDDREVRARAWSLLGDVSNSEFVQVLIKDLALHPDEGVRAGAAEGLRQHRDEPDARRALNRAQSDRSLLVQRAARNALDNVRVTF